MGGKAAVDAGGSLTESHEPDGSRLHAVPVVACVKRPATAATVRGRPEGDAMAMSTVALKREKRTHFRRAPRDRSNWVLCYLADAERRMASASSALWQALYVRDQAGCRRSNPAWDSADAAARRRALESLVRLRNSAQFMFRRANGAIDLLAANEAERLRR